MKIKNNTYWIAGIILLIAAFVYLFKEQIIALFSSPEKKVNEEPQTATDPETGEVITLSPLEYKILNIDSFSKSEQAAIWFEMFRTCPYWRAFVLDIYSKQKDYKSRKGMTLEDFYEKQVIDFMDGMALIAEKYDRCGQSYTHEKGVAEFESIGGHF